MKLIGNIFWILFGGIFISLYYYIMGLIFCITIIGIPFGVQLFKIGTFALLPFGKQSVTKENGSGCLSLIMNIIWLIFGGIEIALAHTILGLCFMVTIVGIPLGYQHFKMCVLALMPFGKEITNA